MPTTAVPAVTPRRLLVERPALTIEGHALSDVSLGGWAYGPKLGTAPVVVIVGGITASPFPLGDGKGEADGGVDPWWPALFSGDLIDPARFTVLCPCWPGNGSTWRGFDGPDPPPAISVPGLADLLAAWLDGIGCTSPITFVGASLGGMVGVAFAVRHPSRCGRLVTISAGLGPDGWGTATRHLQRELVRDGIRNGEVATGMSRARQLGMLTYRGRGELDVRFGKLAPGMERPPVAEYLDYHGRRFAERFPVRTFLLLSEAIDRGSIAPDARTLRAALEQVTAETIVVGVPGDMLFPWALQEELHRQLQAAGAHSSLWKLDSEYGHDAFLADQDRLAELLTDEQQFTLFVALRSAVPDHSGRAQSHPKNDDHEQQREIGETRLAARTLRADIPYCRSPLQHGSPVAVGGAVGARSRGATLDIENCTFVRVIGWNHNPGDVAFRDRVNWHASQVFFVDQVFQGHRVLAVVGIELVERIAQQHEILAQHSLLRFLDAAEIPGHGQCQQHGKHGHHHQQFDQREAARAARTAGRASTLRYFQNHTYHVR